MPARPGLRKASRSQQHRRYVGGLWEELGKLQVDFLAEQGLRPHHQFIDVGCGSLRAGRLLVDYLEPRHYYGIDINVDVMKAGYDHELTDEQRSRLPLVNLRCTDRFDADFGHPFDMAIAQSVFTHLSLNNIRLCLFRLAKVMKPGAKFFATFFEEAAGVPLDTVKKGERFTERNVFLVLPQRPSLGLTPQPMGVQLHRRLGPPARPADARVHAEG